MRTWIPICLLIASATTVAAQSRHTSPSPRYAGGEVVKTTDKEGNVRSTEYDAAGKLRASHDIQVSDTGVVKTTTTVFRAYDERGNRLYSESRSVFTATSSTGEKLQSTSSHTQWWKYDEGGRETQATEVFDSGHGAWGRRTTRGYKGDSSILLSSLTGVHIRPNVGGQGWVDETGRPVDMTPPAVDKGLQNASPTASNPSQAADEYAYARSWMSRVGLRAGFGLGAPKGQLGREASSGWNGSAGLSYSLTPSFALGFRVDFSRFAGAALMPSDFSASQTALSIDTVFQFGDDTFVPHISAGVGMARNVLNFGESSIASWKPGFNVGGGVDFRLSDKAALGADLRYQKFDTFSSVAVIGSFNFSVR